MTEQKIPEHPLVLLFEQMFNPVKQTHELLTAYFIEETAKISGKNTHQAKGVLQGLVVDFAQEILALKRKLKFEKERLEKLIHEKKPLNAKEIEIAKRHAQEIDKAEIELNKFYTTAFARFGLKAPANRLPENFAKTLANRQIALEQMFGHDREPLKPRRRFGINLIIRRGKKPSGRKP